MAEEKMTTAPMTFDAAEIRKLVERMAVTYVGEGYRRAFVSDVERIVRAALASAAPQFDAESELRKEWAFNHGCPAGIAAIYGDDGELHCNACMIDFKRLPMGELHRRVTEKRMGRRSDAAAPMPDGRADLLEALVAARDVLAAFTKQAGFLPQQGGYSTTMTEGERTLAQAVADLDSIIARSAPAAEPPRELSGVAHILGGGSENDSGRRAAIRSQDENEVGAASVADNREGRAGVGDAERLCENGNAGMRTRSAAEVRSVRADERQQAPLPPVSDSRLNSPSEPAQTEARCAWIYMDGYRCNIIDRAQHEIMEARGLSHPFLAPADPTDRNQALGK